MNYIRSFTSYIVYDIFVYNIQCRFYPRDSTYSKLFNYLCQSKP